MQHTTPIKNLATLSISRAIREADDNHCCQIQATEQTAHQELSGHGTAPFPPAQHRTETYTKTYEKPRTLC
jgi:hypothetical protein